LERKLTAHALTLTLYKKFHKGQRNELSETDVIKLVKALLESLRRKAKLNQWQYQILAVVSDMHLSEGGRKGNLHVHIAVFGIPGYTICDWINRYWSSTKQLCKLITEKKWETANWLNYCLNQSLKQFYQAQGMVKVPLKDFASTVLTSKNT